MRGDVSRPFGILGIPWGYISGVLLLGVRGPRGFSNLVDAHPDESQREIGADVCYSAPLHLGRLCAELGTSAALGEISKRNGAHDVGLSDES